MQQIISTKKKELEAICIRLGIVRLYVFGSVTSENDFTEDSDLDFLISFDDKMSPEEYAANYFLLHEQLNRLFQRKIDVITDRSLSNPYFIQSLDNQKVLIYEA